MTLIFNNQKEKILVRSTVRHCKCSIKRFHLGSYVIGVKPTGAELLHKSGEKSNCLHLVVDVNSGKNENEGLSSAKHT